MTKRKKMDGCDGEGDNTVPIPIQTFLWRQSSPFIRPNLEKLCEASCVSFERVLVQNILHGLSPSLCEAIHSVPRWKLVQAALPHVMHCCAAIISQRRSKNTDVKFTNNDIKLLYTLHWVILDAASECEDADNENPTSHSVFSYLHSLDTIQLFVYLFAPLVSSLNDGDFQSLKLENGLRLWQPMWDYRQPDVPCFSTPVKAKRVYLKAQRNLLKVNFNLANIYIGKGTSNDNIYLGPEDDDAAAPSGCSVVEGDEELAPLARLSDICALSTTETATSVEIVCEVCNQTMQSKDGEIGCKCGTRKFSDQSGPDVKPGGLGRAATPVDSDFITKQLENAMISQSCDDTDVLSASYFDVAVLRCLFCPQWVEEGSHWALRYIHHRLLEVYEDMHRVTFTRERSKSLPTPVTPDDDLAPQCLPNRRHEPEEQPVEVKPSVIEKSTRKESSFKRIRVAEIKHIIGDKVKQLRRRESTEQFDIESALRKEESRSSAECLTNGMEQTTLSRPSSSLAKLSENEEGDSYDEDPESGDSASDVSRRKTNAVLRRHRKSVGVGVDDDDDSSGSTKINKSSQTQELPQKPIITITKESPEPSINSPIFWNNRESFSSERSESVETRRIPLQRSQTDSKINYHWKEEVEEVSGSACYIQSNGQINYYVVLLAAHSAAKQQSSHRICGVILNIINCLLDLGIVESEDDATQPGLSHMFNEAMTGGNSSRSGDDATNKNKSKAKKTAHCLAMETIVKVFKTVGCPSGCGDGLRGVHGDQLRLQAAGCLTRLMTMNKALFSSFVTGSLICQPLQEIVDFLHALLGFCSEMSVYSPQGAVPKRPGGAAEPSGGKTGYANNFGEAPGGGSTVQAQVVVQTLKAFIAKCVENKKDLTTHESLGLLCDIRQYLNYVKEVHGGTFRKVMLSGLIDVFYKEPPAKKSATPKTKLIKRTMSVTSDHGDEREWRAQIAMFAEETNAKSRRSIFRRKTKKQLVPGNAMSDTELLDDVASFRAGRLSPRVSMSAAEDDPSSGPSTPKRKFSKFTIAWKRGAKSDHEDDSASEMSEYSSRRDGRSSGDLGGASRQKRMSFKAASQATLSFLSARKRIEDGLKNWNKRRMSRRGSVDEENCRKGNHDKGSSGTEVLILREKKLVNMFAVKTGMFCFNFMLECCNPGALPDPHLIAALLDLDAPVVARAAVYLECAYFVNRCNRGDWPSWMKMSPPGAFHNSCGRNAPSGFRRTLVLQRNAGRLFHQWGEALANRLWDLMKEETPDKFSVLHQIKDEAKKKELRIEDEEENFLDEATMSQSNGSSPYALKMMACQLLLEITTFLRETYRYLPKTKMSRRDAAGWEKQVSSRRWSCALGSPGHSERSNSRSSQGDPAQVAGSPGDRKISFAVFGHGDQSDSIHSSTTTISQLEGNSGERENRRVAAGRKLLTSKMRRGSGPNTSFRHNRSFKLDSGGSIKRDGSSKSRKVSTQSLQSNISVDDASEHVTMGTEEGDCEEQDNVGEMVTDGDDQDYSKTMPWIKAVVTLANTSNFICLHQNYCHPNCYERQRRSCARLITALRKVYLSEVGMEVDITVDDSYKEAQLAKKDSLKDKLKRRESMFQPSSPTRRRESTPLLEKIKTDVSASMRAKLAAALDKDKETKNVSKAKDELPITNYLRCQVQNLTHSPMSIISKAAPILCDETYTDMMPVAWELLLESDQELAAAAGSVFMLSSVRVPDQVQELMTQQLHHQDVNHRINAVLRFSALWRHRWQVWPRMEEGANVFFKVPPPSIDFVLPSPTIGLPSLAVIDPPWTPHFKTKVEEVTINQEESKSFVTATTTRRKQQQEMIHRALLAEEDRRRAARENFHLTSVPIMQQAAYEPAVHHVTEDHEEVMQEELQMAAAAASRRMSVAPANRAASSVNQLRNLSQSGRHSSMFWGRPTIYEGGDEERVEHIHSHHVQLAQHFFPSCICAAALPIIHLVEDLEVNADGVAVREVAEKVIMSCLVEEPTLFLRTFLEKLTVRDKQEELVFLLRKLMYHMNVIPAQTAHCLFNYLVGFIMFYVRSPAEGGQEAIAEALSILWLVVPSVNGIYFKDLKQTLRKEQCDPTLLITANVPSAKKLIVHGPDLSSIPSQFPIHEDTQFGQILQDSLDFFNIPDDQHTSYFLVDTKTNQMHNLNSYVRDFYFFRRNFYPQLSLVHMNAEEASATLQKQALTLKMVEMGKVMFSLSVVLASHGQQMQNHVSFLQEELLKLPSFPRKALEAEFGLHHGLLGSEVFGVDMMHKYVWAKLMATMFHGMSSTITGAGDLPLFLNVINGCLLLHGEDMAMLRYCTAAYINAARRFKQVFATTGFLFIMKTVLCIYSNNQSNPLMCRAIEFTCRQFFLLHRNPYMLQMFGSVAPILDISTDPTVRDSSKVAPEALFSLLLHLEEDIDDELDILELVDGDKPLQALDFCYIDDPDTFSMLDCVNLCVTVVVYACDSVRAMQMLAILEAILPCYLKHLQSKTSKLDTTAAMREELQLISSLAVSMRALVSGSEALCRNFSGPQRQLESVNTSGPKPTQNHNHSPQTPHIYCDEPSDIRFVHMEEGLARRKHHSSTPQEDEADATLKEFRQPRNSLLTIITEYFCHCTVRLRQLRKLLADSGMRSPELLEAKAHLRLADIGHTLLKVAPYDPPTMSCLGLQRYMTDMLPMTEWSQEGIRPALVLILRRLERLFSKIYKKPVLRRHLDWGAASNLLNGVYSTLSKFFYISHLPHLKSLVNVCINIVLCDDLTFGDGTQPSRTESLSHKMAAPLVFCSAAVKLTAMQIQALGEQYSLEHICGGMTSFPSLERTTNMLLNLILPLLIRVGCGRRDAPKMRQDDVNYTLTVLLHTLLPPSGKEHGTTHKSYQHVSMGGLGRSSSLSSSHSKRTVGPREMLLNVAFLGLKLLISCFEQQLASSWHRIAKSVMELGCHLLGGAPLWRFIDFVVTVRTPLSLMLQPFIHIKMMRWMCETEQEYFLQQTVHQKLRGHNMPSPRCKSTTLVDFAAELKQLREDFHFNIGDMRPRTSTIQSDFSRYSWGPTTPPHIPRSSSIHDILEAQALANQLPPSLLKKGKYAKAPQIPAPITSTVPPLSPAVLAAADATAPPGDSPALLRKASMRITALDGSLILEKYMRKMASQEDDAADDASCPAIRSTSPRRLQRQGSIYQRGHMIRQSTLPSPTEEPLYEAENGEAVTGSPARSHMATLDRADSELPPLESSDTDPRMHRLQRQDAKSRKTFKIKRHRSIIKGNIIRSATMKGTMASRSGGGGGETCVVTHTDAVPAFQDIERMAIPQAEVVTEGADGGVAVELTAQAAGAAGGVAAGVRPHPVVGREESPHSPRSPLGPQTPPGPHSPHMNGEQKIKSSRPRFMPKSRSHDDASDAHVSAGTARGRIARQGAKLQMRSRSPSSSPSRCQVTASPAHTQTYVAKCESFDSLSNEEHSALLREEDKAPSNSSLLIFFEEHDLHDLQEMKDTCV